MAAKTATIQAGQEISAQRQLSVDELQKGKTYVYVTQLFVGMFEGFILIAIIMTWIYEYTTAKNLVLISLFHLVLPGTFVLSMIVIPIYWKFWTKSREKGGGGVKHGMRLILAYIFLQVINIGASSGSFVWRIVLFNNGCTATLIADECNNTGFRTVEIAFLTIDAAAIAFGIIGFIMGFLIRAYLGSVANRSIKVKKVFTDTSGNVSGLELAEGRSVSRTSAAAVKPSASSSVRMRNPTTGSAHHGGPHVSASASNVSTLPVAASHMPAPVMNNPYNSEQIITVNFA